MSRERTYAYANTVRKGTNEEAVMTLGGAGPFAVGPAPEFGGRPETLNPEELFVAAVNSCLMTTLFYFLQRSHIELQSYESRAEGRVEKGRDGFRFTAVTVHATATVKEPGAAEQLGELAALAEKYCLVSRSVNCAVHYELHAKVQET